MLPYSHLHGSVCVPPLLTQGQEQKWRGKCHFADAQLIGQEGRAGLTGQHQGPLGLQKQASSLSAACRVLCPANEALQC